MSIVVTDVAPRIHYTASDGQNTFEVPFEFNEIDDVFVYVNEQLRLYNETPGTNEEYDLLGAGGTLPRQVIFGGSGLLAGDLVVIYRDIPVERLDDFDNDGVFPVDELNDTLDALTVMIQQGESELKRTLRQPVADEPIALDDLPNREARANKLLGFDADGQPVAMVAGTGGSGGGTADDALALNGQPGSYYLDRGNHTGEDEIADITGLQGALDLKANINSPVLTGEPHSVTPTAGDDDTKIATTAFVQMSLGEKLSDAPADAVTYGRRNGAWDPAVPEAPSTSLIYGRMNKAWVEVVGGGGGGSAILLGDTPPEATVAGTMWWDSDSGGLYIWFDDGSSGQWVQVAAPVRYDTSQYLTETWGTWTPNLTFGGAQVGMVQANQFGRWRKVGKYVTLWFEVLLSAKGSSVGSAQIANVPFAPVPLVGSYPTRAGVVGYATGFAAGTAPVYCYIGSSVLALVSQAASGTGTQSANDTAFTNTSRFVGSISYEAA